MNTKVFVVTGGNRGIGRELCRQLAQQSPEALVYLTARDHKKGQDAALSLHQEGLTNIVFHPLDVTDNTSIQGFCSHLSQEQGGLDVLINNAGYAAKGSEVTLEMAQTTLAVNTFGVLALTEALRPLFREKARIINVSSGMGALGPYYDEQKTATLTDSTLTQESLQQLLEEFLQDVASGDDITDRGWPASTYAVSKAALNALTRIWTRTWTEKELWFASACPGWVRTDMGGPHASKSVEEGAEGIVWLALAPRNEIGPGGRFIREKQMIPW